MILPDSALHGGPDAGGAVPHDFSTNANAAGPCPFVQARLQALSADRYPDPAHVSLIARLADWHGVSPARIVVGASASELIMRITSAMVRLHGLQLPVRVPRHAYGDYARAAHAWGLPIEVRENPFRRAPQPGAALTWLCDPDSPFGQSALANLSPSEAGALRSDPVSPAQVFLDRVYAPLQLAGSQPDPAQLDGVWQLHSPNKALGLTGVRGAYLIAPADGDEALPAVLRAMAPSWPLGVHAVALLDAWTQARTQDWLSAAKACLRDWKLSQIAGLHARGWTVSDSSASFFCARPPPPTTYRQAPEVTAHTAGITPEIPARNARTDQDTGARSLRLQQHLRTRGIKLRDTSSFGLPGAFRLCVLPPASQEALWHALDDFHD